MKKAVTYPPVMVAMAFVLLAVDSGVSSGSIYDKLAVNGETGQAFAFTLMFAVVIFAISFTAFLKGLELAQQPHSTHRTTNLGILGLAITILVTISVLMNAFFIGADAMTQEWLNTKIEKIVDTGKSTNKLFQYAEDEKLTLKTIQKTSKTWLACERSNGCVNKQGGGDGQTTLVLTSYLNTAENALNEIMELSNEYQPVIERAQETYLTLDFIPKMEHLSFDEKLDKAAEEIGSLSATFNELQTMLPIRTFETLSDAFDTSINQYVAQDLSPVGARTLYNHYNKHAERYEGIAKTLKRGKLVQIPSIYKPSDWEIMTSSSNALFIWLMSVVLASFGWIMLGIHIIQNTRGAHHPNSDIPPPRSSVRQVITQTEQDEQEALTVFHTNQSTTKH